VPGPESPVEHERERLLGVVVDEGEVLGEAALSKEGNGPLGAPLFIAVGRVDEDRELGSSRELDLLGEDFIFLGRLK
jgi:hypothetical protein